MSLLNKFMEEIIKEAKDKQYVYHIKDSDFKGNTIYSLEMMKQIDKSIYNKSIKKYKDRKDHISKKIKLLDCTWADVINLSTLNPLKIFMAARLIGNKNNEYNVGREVFQIPIDNLKDSEFCLYNDNYSQNSSKAYSNISIAKYKENEFVPEKTIEYFIDCLEKNEDPLMFAYVDHILVKDQVSLNNSKTLKFDPDF